ncbi:MAG: ATP-binding protein [Nocardioidaceae bacterium]
MIAISKINIIPQDIGRVLLNLFANAFYAVNEKMKEWKGRLRTDCFYNHKKVGDKVEVRVGDNGNGIPQKVLDKIFSTILYYQAHRAGNRIGIIVGL